MREGLRLEVGGMKEVESQTSWKQKNEKKIVRTINERCRSISKEHHVENRRG